MLILLQYIQEYHYSDWPIASKFEGAFNANGLDGKNQTAMINNITSEEIGIIINKIEKVYQKFIQS